MTDMGGQPGGYAYHPQQQSRRKGLMPLIIGGLMLLVGTPLAFLLPIALGMGDLFGALLNPASSGDTRYLPQDEQRVLYVMGEDGQALSPSDCSVTDPAGTPVDLHSELDGATTSDQHFFSFHSNQAGDYTLDCGRGAVMAVAPGDALDGVVGWAVGAFLLALLVFLVSLGLIIWGIAQLVRTGNGGSDAHRAAVGGHPGGGFPPAGSGSSPAGPGPVGHAPPGNPVQGGAAAPPSPQASREPHPLNGVQGRPAPQYGQYAPGHGGSEGEGSASDTSGGAHRL